MASIWATGDDCTGVGFKRVNSTRVTVRRRGPRRDFGLVAAENGGQLVLLGVTGGPVRIGEGRKPLARSQTLSENSQMASGAVSATGSAEADAPGPQQHADSREKGQRTTDEADHHQRPRKQSGSPHQVAQKNPVPRPGAELRA